MTKINVISGFLGAGKTTLIKKLLQGSISKEKTVLLENEYGEIGVDGAFLKNSGITITEMNSGCICCTLAGDFQKAIDELISTYHPDRLIIEPSGVGKLSEILLAVDKAKKHHPELDIGGCATVVDAGKCRMYMKNFGEFFLDQVKSAATVIFSRTQLLSADRVEKSRQLIEAEHPGVRVVTTPWEDLDADTLLEVIESGKPMVIEPDEHEHHHHDHEEHDHHHDEHCGCDHDHNHDHDHDHDHDQDHEHHHDEGCSCGHDHHDHDHHHHHADEVFQSIGLETANRYTRERIKALTDKLTDEEEYGSILRAKGILQSEDGTWFEFDYVPGELQFRDGHADYTGRLCVIGAHVEEDALRALFRA